MIMQQLPEVKERLSPWALPVLLPVPFPLSPKAFKRIRKQSKAIK